LQVQLAAVRSHYGLADGDVHAAERFRDKGLMKDALRQIGVPCARHRRIRSDEDAWAFAAEVGFPIVLKPPSGAGSRSTYEVHGPDDLRRALAEMRPERKNEVLGE